MFCRLKVLPVPYGNNPHIKAFTLLIQIISFNFADIKANRRFAAEGPSSNAPGDGYFWGLIPGEKI
jgi:hypothetical protein